MVRRSRSVNRALAVAVAACGLFWPERLAAQDRTVTAGISVKFASGTFGSSQTTHVVFVPAELRVDAGRFEIAGLFPFLSIGAGTVTAAGPAFIPMLGSMTSAPGAGMTGHGGGGMMGGGSPGGGTAPAALSSTGASGSGDVVVSLGYRVIDSYWSRTQVVVNGRAKLPSASSSSGLGTGRADWSVSGAIRKRFDDGWIAAEAGYLAVGDPSGFDLRNAAQWSVGGGKRIAARVYLLATAAGSTVIVPGFTAPAEVSAGIGIRLTDRLTITAAPTLGLTQASPSGLSIGLSTRLFPR